MKQRRILAPLVIAFLLAILTTSVAPWENKKQEQPIAGFTLQSSRQERSLEARLASIPQPLMCRSYLRYLTAEPHMAGTERNYQLALYVRDKFKEFGLDEVSLVEYQVLLSYPREIVVEMVAPKPYRATLREHNYFSDQRSDDSQVSIGFNAYSSSGELTAPLVYANGGNPEDYDQLLQMGIDIKGKVALVRYSMPYSYRGFKALTAQKRGAAALLIYSDPMEDGYIKGKVYPYGPWGPESHLQRGGIPFDFIAPGDPLTPGWASLKDARRLKPEESEILPKIISVPLSYKDARPLLENLAGPEAPEAWQGGLPLTYHTGPGATKVHLKVEMDSQVRSIWNVIGKIKGSLLPEEMVIVGNHRDAWVYGAVDPSSGTASLLEVARALGKLRQEGVRLRRSIILANWDAEEFTLTGSTEWGEEMVAELKKGGVAYLNVDSACSGSNFGANAVPSLEHLLPAITEEVIDPHTGKTIYQVWKERVEKEEGKSLVNTRLGSGSDYTVFLNFVGMPIIDMGFAGPYGVYHSRYDDFYWMSRFGDPDFRYMPTLSAIWGIAALRLANAEVLPFDYTSYGEEITGYIKQLSEEAEKSGNKVEFKPLQERVERFILTARRLNLKIEEILASGDPPPREKADLINRCMMKVERDFTHPDGIPGRPWFKHLIYAPRFTYAAEVLPGITEALREGDETHAQGQIELLAQALQQATHTLEGALEQLP
ncbi:glutamate carboxypeptidase [bacterium (candidate division B38) B3_B38]|nr:MAG: glutamate carboxypeptidase [bacterium (candidate division B38) B3_B38]